MDRVVLRHFGKQSKSKPTVSELDNNLLRLKRISQSFEDLTSETLYSKWKRARKKNDKSGRRERSLSLIGILPEEEFDINGNAQKRQFSVANLQRKILRPRGFTLCSGELDRFRSQSIVAKEAVDINDNENSGTNSSSLVNLQEELSRSRSWTVCTSELSRHNNAGGAVNTSDCPTDCLSETPLFPTEADRVTNAFSSENLDKENNYFASAASNPELRDTIETKKFKIIEEIMPGISTKASFNAVRKARTFSERDLRRNSDSVSVMCRLISDPGLNSNTYARRQSCREQREIEFLRTAEFVQRYLDNNKMAHEDVWQKRGSSGDIVAEGRHKRVPRGSVIQSRSEVNNNACNIQEASLGFQNDRSQPDASKRYALGCTYAMIRQPEPQISQSNSEDFIDKLSRESPDQSLNILTRTMSVPSQGLGKKESRSSEEKERDERIVKFKDVDGSDMKGSHHGVRRAQTLPRMPKRPLVSLTSKNWKESELKTRKGAEDLIKNINNSNEKSAEERVDIVEKAFEWIRKEVADLRAQDKDIMRMFTKIQAGIRHIKFDQSTLMESEEEFISTPDLSHDHSAPVSEEYRGVTVHRRASLL